ncbi:FkbM family methyltransferase [Uliginosibacterium sp. H3]|uniref:FkbM family methyltransferase n=1 Tax=Uliginosibacterium silvisoli TaxID=3114758 RepID=A0ABU6K790_9RHOO|nr:FkbM family methyltransferase [Uliginosibacterium sp. H3]
MAISRRLLDFVLRGRDTTALPLHVLLPGDEVSGEMLVAGIHEGQLLQPLMDHFLAAHKPHFANEVALDVGANIGNHSLFFSRHFRTVLSVEPNPRTLTILRANAALSGADVRVLPVGFADQDGALSFFSNHQGNLGASGFAFAQGPTDARSGEQIECAARRGDAVLKEVLGVDGAPRIGLIKLDVEGAELSALRGLTECLARDKPFVIFESLRTDGESGGLAIFSFLRGAGYASFYAIESSVTSAKPSAFGWLRRLFCGEHVRLRRLEAPVAGDAYLMILAVPAGRELVGA